MTDLEYELAMMADEYADVRLVPVGFLDKPESWKSALSSAYENDPRWFDRAITEYLKGR